jgi:hypothetical protein
VIAQCFLSLTAGHTICLSVPTALSFMEYLPSGSKVQAF